MLRAIANSPDELQSICDTIVASVMRLCTTEVGDLGLPASTRSTRVELSSLSREAKRIRQSRHR